LISDHNLLRREILLTAGTEEADVQCAQACGIDFVYSEEFLSL
jgi:hypothetical protein